MKETQDSLSCLSESNKKLRDTHEHFAVDTRAKLTIMEADLQNHSTEMESVILKSKKQSNDLHAMNSRVTDVSRQIENINEPENNAFSSLKGEFKILRQNCKIIGDDLKSLHENVLSNKNSVSNLRSKLATYDQQFGKSKSVQSFCESSKSHTPTSATPVSYSDAVQREEQHAAVQHSPPVIQKKPPPQRTQPVRQRSVTPTTAPINATNTAPKLPQPIPVMIQPRTATSTRRVFFNSSVHNANISSDNKNNQFISANNNADVMQYYIGNINPSVSVEVIESFLSRRNINFLKLNVFYSRKRGVKAAKLSVTSSDANVIGVPHFWPSGVYARIWHD